MAARETRSMILCVLLFTILVGAGALVACGGAEGAGGDVTRSDSAGIEIVTNTGTDRVLDWTFEPRLKIGGADTGAASFYEVSSSGVATDSTGRIFVIDRPAFRLAAFDERGTALWATGREGGAPGEFKFPFTLVVNGDSVAVIDAAGPKIEWFAASDGRHLGSVRLSQFVPQVAPTPQGRIISYAQFDQENARRTQLIGRATERDTIVIARTPPQKLNPVQFEGCPIGFPGTPVLSPPFTWRFWAGRLFLLTGPAYAVQVLRDTLPVASYRRAIAPAPANAEIAAAEYPDGFKISVPSAGIHCDIPAEQYVSKTGFADVVQAVAVRGLLAYGSVGTGRAADPHVSQSARRVGRARRRPHRLWQHGAEVGRRSTV